MGNFGQKLNYLHYFAYEANLTKGTVTVTNIKGF